MRKLVISFFFFCLAFFILFSSGFADSQDGLAYLAVARQMYYHRTFTLPPGRYPQQNVNFSDAISPSGKRYSPTGLGYSLALLPAVAAEDLVLRLAGTEPLAYFPLQSDWPVLLFATWTNAFFGALLAVWLLAYFRTFGLSASQAVISSFLAIVASNLLPYTKHTFAHMMFTAFLVGSFYWVRRYSLAKKPWHLLAAGICFGVVMITYNPTFILPAFPLFLYWLLLVKPWQSRSRWWRSLRDAIWGVAGLLPWAGVYWWFNHVRFGVGAYSGYGPSGGLAAAIPPIPATYVLVDGIWNLLFSSGKSVILYSPLMLVIGLYWWKLKREWRPEIVAFGCLFLIYVYFFGTLTGGADYMLWHGESSWGPRYMTAVIPFVMIVSFLLIHQLHRRAQLLVVAPLVGLGLGIQLVGMLLPYQIRFAGLQVDAWINNRNFVVYEYGNIIPRYAPWFTMTKTLVRRLQHYPQQLDHGPYNVRLQEGFDTPFWHASTYWRGLRPVSLLVFDNQDAEPLRSMTLAIGNHQLLPQSSASAVIRATLNDAPPLFLTLGAGAKTAWEIFPATGAATLRPTHNRLLIEHTYPDNASVSAQTLQAVFLQRLEMNGQAQNLLTLDYPFVSPVSQRWLGSEYVYYQRPEVPAWAVWNNHSAVYEQTFDLWWLRPLHFWDLPKGLYAGLLIANLGVLITAAYGVWRSTKIIS